LSNKAPEGELSFTIAGDFLPAERLFSCDFLKTLSRRCQKPGSFLHLLNRGLSSRYLTAFSLSPPPMAEQAPLLSGRALLCRSLTGNQKAGE
jgi:hypothetical protein